MLKDNLIFGKRRSMQVEKGHRCAMQIKIHMTETIANN
jgi:hypothetical protein